LCIALSLLLPLCAHAGWMAEFQDATLSALVLPGTHDSATYHPAGLGISPDEPELSWVPKALQGLVANWGVAQTLDIGQQARRGYRYFDIRLCAYGDTVYTCHGIYMVPFDEVLNQLHDFLGRDQAKSEVVVLHINHFYGMTAAHHDLVIQHLRAVLGPWTANPTAFAAGVDSKVGDFVQSGSNLIVVYTDQATVDANPDLLWPDDAIDSPWPNQQRLWPLEQYLAANNQRSHAGQIFVHQSQLTPDQGNDIAGLFAPNRFPSSLQAFTANYIDAEWLWMKTARGKAAVGNGGVIIQDFVDGRLVDYAIRQNRRLFP
jgi:hypothetical protein